MTQGSVNIISGCPASGKTTLARRLAEESDRHLHLQTDHFYEALGDLIDPSRPESKTRNENIVRQFSLVANGFCMDGYHVLLDGVIGPWMLPIVSEFVGRFRYAILHPDLATALNRGAFRTEKLVTPESISKMHREFTNHRPGFEPYYFEDVTGLLESDHIPLFDGHH